MLAGSGVTVTLVAHWKSSLGKTHGFWSGGVYFVHLTSLRGAELLVPVCPCAILDRACKALPRDRKQ